MLCNKVEACGATFHALCLASQDYDLNAHDGCIRCQIKPKFLLRTKKAHSKSEHNQGGITNKKDGRAAANNFPDVITIDSDVNKEEGDDVIVID